MHIYSLITLLTLKRIIFRLYGGRPLGPELLIEFHHVDVCVIALCPSGLYSDWYLGCLDEIQKMHQQAKKYPE